MSQHLMAVFPLTASIDIDWLTIEHIFPIDQLSCKKILNFDNYWLFNHITASTEDCLSTISNPKLLIIFDFLWADFL